MMRQALVAVLLIFATAAPAQTAPPPRSMADVLAVLDQYKPDPQKVSRLKAEVAKPPPQTTDRVDLFRFYFARAEAAGQLGMVTQLFTGNSPRQALRQAMLHLLDHDAGKGDDGKPLYAYAHPMFWAPFSLVGDGN
jgi:hypothetical protein